MAQIVDGFVIGIVRQADDGVGGSVELAVLGDFELTERQKQSLLDVYALKKTPQGASRSRARGGEIAREETPAPLSSILNEFSENK